MKNRLLFATALAAVLVALPLRSEPKKPGGPQPSISAEPDIDPAGAEAPPKKERPRRPAGARAKPARPAAPLPPGEATGAPSSKATAGKRTWLGISTNYLDPSLREHLELPDGFGIQVVEVMPDSPASAAKLRANDVLVRFGDQRLISPDHLSLLVREKTKGERVSLTLVRKGREETLEVELGEADETVFGPFGQGPRFLPGPPPLGEDARLWQERLRRQQDELLRRQQDYWQDWMDQHRPGWRSREAKPHPPKPGGKPGEDAGKVKPGGGAPTLKVNPGFPLRVFGTEGVLKIDNEQGELTLTRKDGKHHLVIHDEGGKLVYDGPFDPEKGVEALPETARDRLEAMKLGNLEIRLPEPPEHPPGKTADPNPGKDKPAKSSGELL